MQMSVSLYVKPAFRTAGDPLTDREASPLFIRCIIVYFRVNETDILFI